MPCPMSSRQETRDCYSWSLSVPLRCLFHQVTNTAMRYPRRMSFRLPGYRKQLAKIKRTPLIVPVYSHLFVIKKVSLCSPSASFRQLALTLVRLRETPLVVRVKNLFLNTIAPRLWMSSKEHFLSKDVGKAQLLYLSQMRGPR